MIESPVQILKEIRDVIKDPEHWTQGAWAEDKWGGTVSVQQGEASKFCLIGACNRVEWNHAGEEGMATNALIARNALRETLEHGTLIVYNDTHGHQDVLDLIDKTIRRLDG